MHSSNGIRDLRSVSSHIASHNVSCHPTQLNAPQVNSSKTGRQSFSLPQRDERLSWRLTWVVDPDQESNPRPHDSSKSDALPLRYLAPCY